MKHVYVRFMNTWNTRVYVFKTELNNLIPGGVYNIVADGRTTYDNPVQIVDIQSNGHTPKGIEFREITSATIVEAPPKPPSNIHKLHINKEKGAVCIVWKDGTKTIVRCQEGDEFDFEKGIALCYMKKAFDNRGCYNDVFKMVRQQMESEDE